MRLLLTDMGAVRLGEGGCWETCHLVCIVMKSWIVYSTFLVIGSGGTIETVNKTSRCIVVTMRRLTSSHLALAAVQANYSVISHWLCLLTQINPFVLRIP